MLGTNTVTIQSDLLLETLVAMKKEGLASIRTKLLSSLPLSLFKKGTSLWWERAELAADEDIKKQRLSRRFSVADDLIKALQKEN
jgi:hypothetical protein